MQVLIEAKDLTCAIRKRVIVDRLSLSVGAGEIYALVGPDGAGKTTTMRLLCGALSPSEGDVRLAGFDLLREPEKARAQIGYLPQRFSLYGELTVTENLRFFAEVRGLQPEVWPSRSMEVLEFVGLSEFQDRRAEDLSGGMKQKLGLAAALVHSPRILLLDEPTCGVDPVTRQSFWQLLIRLLRQGVAVLISTPYMDEASRCNRVGLMQSGRLLMEGTPESIVSGLEGRIVELVGGPRKLVEEFALADEHVEDVQSFGDRLHLRVASGSAEGVMRRLESSVKSRGGSVESLVQAEPILEDAFIALLAERR